MVTDSVALLIGSSEGCGAQLGRSLLALPSMLEEMHGSPR